METRLEQIKEKAVKDLEKISDLRSCNLLYLKIFGKKGEFTNELKKLKTLSLQQRPKYGRTANKLKKEIQHLFLKKKEQLKQEKLKETIDLTSPGIPPKTGHLHIVTQAIEEIRTIFERIGFTLVRHREVEWDWYAFGSLNFPPHHPARDDFETFFIDAPASSKYGRMLLSPHTSSGQVREMEKTDRPPIRMINIAKCYRPNWDVSHTPMFYQFEGLVIDKEINITHLKGTMDYFAREYFGKERKTRLRPFHFQFTEPSFEVDINCGICQGLGCLKDKSKCRYCKEGWMELGGAGMVHPQVLKSGKIDPNKYTGFAFGWGVERTFMMKSGTQLDDNRLVYSNDIRFLEQF